MKTTRYFDEQVLLRLPYINSNGAKLQYLRRRGARDNRTVEFGIGDRFSITPDGKSRMLRVVTLDDGETVHNTFFDRNFR